MQDSTLPYFSPSLSWDNSAIWENRHSVCGITQISQISFSSWHILALEYVATNNVYLLILKTCKMSSQKRQKSRCSEHMSLSDLGKRHSIEDSE